MSALVGDLARFATGRLYDFSWAAWLGITLVLLLGGVVFGSVSRRVTDPVAVEVALRPGRVAGWMAVMLVASPLVFVVLVFTYIGVPLAVLWAFGLLLAGILGYLAICLVAGDRICRAAGSQPPSWVSICVGIVAVRIIRLIPVVGASVHSLVAWAGVAATSVVVWDLAVSWHRRRMPDAEQFAGEHLVEWPASDALQDHPISTESPNSGEEGAVRPTESPGSNGA